MLVFHNRGTTDFSTLGIGTVDNIQSLNVTYNINKQPELNATFIVDSVKSFIKNENIVSHNGIAFYIKDMTFSTGAENTYSIKCKHVSTLVNDIIADVDNLFGTTAYETLRICLSRQSNLMENKIYLIDNKDLPDGMQWVTKRFDISSIYKSNVGKVIDDIINKTNGELYIDNFGIAIVKKLGKVMSRPLTLGIDISKLTLNQNSDNLITRMYPLGSGNFGIGSVTSDGREYIDSTNVGTYGFKEAFKEFSVESTKPYGGASVLLDEAKASMDSPVVRTNENYEKTREDWINPADQKDDLTKDSMTASLYKGILTRHMVENGSITVFDLGDIVNIRSLEKQIDLTTRITGFSLDLISYENSTIEFNRPEFTPSSSIGKSIVNSDTIISMLNADNKFKADFIETSTGMGYLKIQNDAADINIEVLVDNCVGSKLFMGNDTEGKMVRTVVGPGLIANGVYDDSTEDWVWSLFMADGNLILGDGTSGVLNTAKVTVRSSTGNLEIKDNILSVQNMEGIEVLKLGLSEIDNRAMFEMRNSIGKKTFWLDDQGNAVFSGSIYGSEYIGTPADKFGKEPYVYIYRNEIQWCGSDQLPKKRIAVFPDKIIDITGIGNGVYSGEHWGIPMYETQVLQTKSASAQSFEIRFCTRQGKPDVILEFKLDGLYASGPDTDGKQIKLV